MLRVLTNITIEQKTQIKEAPLRNKVIKFDFVVEMSCSDSWRDFTNQAEITVPKNLYVRDKNNKLIPLSNSNIGGFQNVGAHQTFESSFMPLLMRGDKVTIDYAYRYFKKGKEVTEGTYDTKTNTHLFVGYISQVSSKKPINFKVEDNSWILKQLPCPIRTFKATDTLEDIMRFLFKPYNEGKPKDEQFTVNSLTKTTFGVFRVGNETVSEVLARLRKQYHFESYFKGNELRVGSMIYIESEAKTYNFTFQQNIISDDLEYKRKDDIVLSIVASNKIETETGETTKDGHKKTKCERLEVLVTLRNGSDEPTYFIKKKGEEYPPNTGGERMTMPYPFAKSIDELKSLALTELKKYYYTGFKGKFTTFGIPFVRMGDNVQLQDNILPERNGLYKVRSVNYKAGFSGIRQEVQLDFKLL